VPARGERVAFIILLLARVLAEQAGVDAPVVAADAAAETQLIVELERVVDRGPLSCSSEFGVLNWPTRT
jgi:hypothetical protein